MYLMLTIDNQRKAIDVEFQRIKMTNECKEKLEGKLLSMNSLTAGHQEEKPVCYKYSWSINCINWKLKNVAQ